VGLPAEQGKNEPLSEWDTSKQGGPDVPIVIDPRFCGPPDSANGGYFAGVVAESMSALQSGAVEVTLRQPPPLGEPMTATQQEDGVEVRHGELLVAQARLVGEDLTADLPDPMTPQQAERAGQSYVFATSGHPFPTCFVCGPQRDPGDGLRIFPGAAGDVVGCTWTPDNSLGDASGAVRPEFLWSALDCPAYFGALSAGAADTSATLLGRITALVQQRPQVGQTLVVQGWCESVKGRRSFAGAALFTGEGQLCGVARSVWVRMA
jgi:hypothetical protein